MIVLASRAVSRPPMTLAVAPTATRPDRLVATNTPPPHQIYTLRVYQGGRKGSGVRMLGRRFLRRGTNSMRTSIGGMPASKRGSTHMRIAEITPNLREPSIEKVRIFTSQSIQVHFWSGESRSLCNSEVCLLCPPDSRRVGVGLVPWFSFPRPAPRSTLGKILR